MQTRGTVVGPMGSSVRTCVMTLVVALVLTGCGSSSASTPATSAEPSAATLTTPNPAAASIMDTNPSSSTVPTEMPASTPTETPTAAAAETPSALPSPTGTATPASTSPRTPGPTPQPPMVKLGLQNPGGAVTVAFITSGDHITSTLSMASRGVDTSACVLRHQVTPDKPWIDPSTVRLEPRARQTVRLIDGRHRFTANCPVSKTLVPSGVVEAAQDITVFDGQPEACAKFSFEESGITATTFAELASGVIGRWSGCASTPWTPPYRVDVEFRADGTYSAKSDEVLDDQAMTALYYGVDEDSPYKSYAINDVQASMKGVGQIDLVFDVDRPGTRGDLRNIRLMGDKLELEVFNREYGPVTLQLDREGSSD